MRSSTSSSERFVAALAATFFLLLGSWEAVLRLRAGVASDASIDRPPMSATTGGGERWVIFGNCLVMTGVSPKGLGEKLGDDRERTIVNIAAHEQSPVAFFDYLRRAKYHPDVIITNVSSWINGTNFDQEATLIARVDPLGVFRREPPEAAPAAPSKEREQAFRQEGPLGGGQAQRRVEDALSRWMSTRVQSFGHKYHLFDYSLFLGTLVTSADLDNALYQLSMQSWFRVTGSQTDGLGYLGMQVEYRDDWNHGLDVMAERYLKRLRLSRLLTATYWALLEEHIRYFQSHGTQVFLVRMPEHPRIREFNDQTYELTERLRAFEERMNVPFLDLSRLGLSDGIHLFDAVHPDAKAAELTTDSLATWLRSKRVNVERATGQRQPGGG